MKALIAMSGGVDSSVAAMLAQNAGYECIGCTMQLFDAPSCPGSCGNGTAGSTSISEDPAADARAVAETLGIPFHLFDMRDSFRQEVIEDFIEQYSSGRTPNPCIVCNMRMKFGALLEKATDLGCDRIVTGHYARIIRNEDSGMFTLAKAKDLSKDQSYVLYHLSQEQLSRILLPLGEYSKDEVRGLAAEAGLVNAHRTESQDICFVPDGDYAAVIRSYTGRDYPPGDFVDLEGNVIGTHKGIISYTIGQHKRLGQAFGVPRYVCAIDGENNRITLGGPEDVFASSAELKDCRWILGKAPEKEIRCRVRLRYKQQEQWATVHPILSDQTVADREGSTPDAEILFDEPQRAITPGQAAVFYDGDRVLGGGTICPTIP